MKKYFIKNIFHNKKNTKNYNKKKSLFLFIFINELHK